MAGGGLFAIIGGLALLDASSRSSNSAVCWDYRAFCCCAGDAGSTCSGLRRKKGLHETPAKCDGVYSNYPHDNARIRGTAANISAAAPSTTSAPLMTAAGSPARSAISPTQSAPMGIIPKKTML